MAKEKIKKEKVKKEKKDSFFKGVRNEMKKVHLASVKDTVKYSLTTVFLVLFMVGFFELINLLASFIKGMFI